MNKFAQQKKEEFLAFLNEVGERRGGEGEAFTFEVIDSDKETFIFYAVAVIYTAEHFYNISASFRNEEDSSGYLGCIASARAPFPGEQHTRGNDLPDGPFCKETWEKIKNAIISYELKTIYQGKKGKK